MLPGFEVLITLQPHNLILIIICPITLMVMVAITTAITATVAASAVVTTTATFTAQATNHGRHLSVAWRLSSLVPTKFKASANGWLRSRVTLLLTFTTFAIKRLPSSFCRGINRLWNRCLREVPIDAEYLLVKLKHA